MGKDKDFKEDLGNVWFFAAVEALNTSDNPKVLEVKREKLSDLLQEMTRVHTAMTGEDHILGSHLGKLDLSDKATKKAASSLSFESNKVRRALFVGLNEVAKANGSGKQPWITDLAK